MKDREAWRVAVHGVKESQTRLSRHDRQQNVENVFSLKDGEQLRHRHVLLIDDIVTTGATLSECARTLGLAGAEKVLCACVARSRG